MIRVGFVTGLAAESACLRRGADHEPDIARLIRCAAADPARAQREAQALIDAGAGALVSLGIAGGLAPELYPGRLLLPQSVIAPSGEHLVIDSNWHARLVAHAVRKDLDPVPRSMAGSDLAVRRPTEKAGLHQRSGAVAVDMESHAVGQVAQTAGLPFLVLRVVADPALRPLPRAVKGSIGSDGRPRPGVVAARLVLTPWELPDLLRLRRDAATALQVLQAAVRSFGPLLTRIEG